MNRSNTLLKAAALTSSILLVAGVVLYKAGALAGLMEAAPIGEPMAVVGQGGSDAPPDTPGAPGKQRKAAPPRDSLRIDGRAKGHPPIEDSLRRDEVFFTGSKSGVPLIKPFDSATAGASDTVETTRSDTAPRRERFMGGSKSLAPLIETPVSKPQGADTPSRRKP